MRGPIGFAFILQMLFPIILFVPELIIYGVQSTKMNDLAEQTTKHAELVGGITEEVKATYQATLKEYGLDPDKFTIAYSKEGMVQHKGKFTVQIKGSYTFRTFNFFGTGIGNFTLPMTGTDSGVSEVWIR